MRQGVGGGIRIQVGWLVIAVVGLAVASTVFIVLVAPYDFTAFMMVSAVLEFVSFYFQP